MIVRGLDRVYVSVEKMEESLSFFRDFVGMAVVGENILDSGVLQKMLSLPDGPSGISRVGLQPTGRLKWIAPCMKSCAS